MSNESGYTQEDFIKFLFDMYNDRAGYTPPKNGYTFDRDKFKYLDEAANQEEARNLISRRLKEDQPSFNEEFRLFKDYYNKKHGEGSIKNNVTLDMVLMPEEIKEKPTDVGHLSKEQVRSLCDKLANYIGYAPTMKNNGEVWTPTDKMFGLGRSNSSQRAAWKSNVMKLIERNWGEDEGDKEKGFIEFKKLLGFSKDAKKEEVREFISDLIDRGRTQYDWKDDAFVGFLAPQSVKQLKEGKKPDAVDIGFDLGGLAAMLWPAGKLAQKGMMPLTFGSKAGPHVVENLMKSSLGAGALTTMNEAADYTHDVVKDLFDDKARFSRKDEHKAVNNPFKANLNLKERAINIGSGIGSGAATGGILQVGNLPRRYLLRKLDPDEFFKQERAHKEAMRASGQVDFDKGHSAEEAEQLWAAYHKLEKQLFRAKKNKKSLEKVLKKGAPEIYEPTNEDPKLRRERVEEIRKKLEGKEDFARRGLEGMKETGRRYASPKVRAFYKYLKGIPSELDSKMKIPKWIAKMGVNAAKMGVNAAKIRNFDSNNDMKLGNLYGNIIDYILNLGEED